MADAGAVLLPLSSRVFPHGKQSVQQQYSISHGQSLPLLEFVAGPRVPQLLPRHWGLISAPVSSTRVSASASDRCFWGRGGGEGTAPVSGTRVSASAPDCYVLGKGPRGGDPDLTQCGNRRERFWRNRFAFFGGGGKREGLEERGGHSGTGPEFSKGGKKEGLDERSCCSSIQTHMQCSRLRP